MRQVVVHKGRTNKIAVGLNYDVSQDEISSEIRADKSRTSEFIASWTVSFLTDGTDGELVLVLDDSVTQGIEKSTGWMDLKRISAGEPISVFDDPIEVLFKETITV